MTRKHISVFISTLVLIACNNAAPVQETESVPVSADSVDMNAERVLSMDVTKVIPGSEQIRKAYSYFIVKGRDTSGFRCHFSEWKADSTLFFVAKFSPKMTYMQQKSELVRIMAAATNDFNLKALNTIGIGRLVTTGDLAVKVSSQFYAIKFNEELNAFLAHSALSDDMNSILNPYGIKVKEVVTEKQVFLPQQDLFKYSIIETPVKEITEEIVDGIVYLKLEKV